MMRINRRKLMLGSVGAAIVITLLKAKANSGARPQDLPKYFLCGKMSSTDLRHFYCR